MEGGVSYSQWLRKDHTVAKNRAITCRYEKRSTQHTLLIFEIYVTVWHEDTSSIAYPDANLCRLICAGCWFDYRRQDKPELRKTVVSIDVYWPLNVQEKREVRSSFCNTSLWQYLKMGKPEHWNVTHLSHECWSSNKSTYRGNAF